MPVKEDAPMEKTAPNAEYRRTFVAPVPVERAWQAFVDPRQREAWISPPGHDQLENPQAGFPAPGFAPLQVEIGEVEPFRRLSWSVQRPLENGPPTRIEVVVSFDEAETGTRVSAHRRMSGEGSEWELVEQMTRLGFGEEMTDLCAYLETGVNVSRHFSARSSIGALLKETPAGLRIARVAPGGFAEEAGLQADDLLVSIAGAAVYARSDVAFLQREREVGEILEVCYVRDGALRRSRGHLSEKYYSEIASRPVD
jgi:uncharacterized protein YndB with AHSA1/START domain